MIDPKNLQKSLCSAFCSGIHVEAVPCGYAISSAFLDRSGDRISLYLVEESDGYRLEDDGEYLSRLIALNVDIESGTRGNLLSSILQNAGADWDRESLVIRTGIVDESDIATRVISFLSALIRARDLELVTREIVRSTFREDAMTAIEGRFADVANINEGKSIKAEFADFPSDAIIQPRRGGKPAAVYFVSTNEHLSEALLLQTESERLNQKGEFSVIALLEDYPSPTISSRKFKRAQNRDLLMPIFRDEEEEALKYIERKLALSN